MGVIANLMVNVGADISNFESGMMRTRSGLEGLNSGAQSAVGGIMKIATSIGLVAVAGKAFGMIKDSVQAAFSRIDTMDRFNRTITTMTGSVGDAKKGMDSLTTIVKGTAYGLDIAAKATQDFVTRGMSIDQATGSVKAWADAVAFYGNGSSEQFANVTDAIAKMRTKGTVEMDQLNRLFDSGIDAVGIYAKATGQSASDVQDALSKGEISANDFANTVENAMETGANGVINIAGKAQEAGTSWQGTFSNMTLAVTRGMKDIIESIDNMLAVSGLPSMKEMVAGLGSNFEASAVTISGWIGTLGPLFAMFAGDFGSKSADVKKSTEDMQTAWSNFWTEFTKDTGGITENQFWSFVQTNTGQIITGFNNLALCFALTFGDIIWGLNAFNTAMEPVGKTFRDWGDNINGVFASVDAASVTAGANTQKVWEAVGGGFRLIGETFNAIGGSINWVFDQFMLYSNNASNTWVGGGINIMAMTGQVGGAFQTMGAGIAGVGEWFNQTVINMVSWGVWAGDSIRNALNGAGDWWKAQFNNVMDFFANLGPTLQGYGASAIAGLWQGIVDAKNELMSNIGGFATDVVNKFHELFDAHSDSKIMVNLGYDIAHGLITGLNKPDLVGFIAGFVQKAVSAFGQLSGGISAVGGDVAGWISQAMAITGQSGADNFNHLMTIAMNESGGNPNAINLWDSNAMAGIPSMGLMQTIQPTFDAYSQGGSIWDPVANAVAAINYMISRYGSIANTGTHGYAMGTNYAAPGLAWTGENGPELIDFGGGGATVYDNKTSEQMANSKQPLIIKLYLSGTQIAEEVIEDVNILLGQKYDMAERGN